jgi:hypothetical protein
MFIDPPGWDRPVKELREFLDGLENRPDRDAPEIQMSIRDLKEDIAFREKWAGDRA